MSTYCPNLATCYGCFEELKNGDQIIGYFEHYMHVKCTPEYILETKQVFEYRSGRLCDDCQGFMIFNLQENVYEHVETGLVTCRVTTSKHCVYCKNEVEHAVVWPVCADCAESQAWNLGGYVR